MGILPRKIKSPRRKGVKRVNPVTLLLRPCNRVQVISSPPPHPWGGTSLQANVESQSQSKISLDKPGLVKNLFLESPGNYQVRR